MKPNNPFLISGYHSPEYFCDRKQETASIIHALHNGRNLTLIAPRRMGKTGLIKNVFHQLKTKQPEVNTFYMDIFSTQNLGEFIQLLAGTILGKLDSTPQKAIARISKFIKSFRPVFIIDELTGAPKIMLDTVPPNEENTLKELFEYLQSSEKHCYIAIDEFQQIAEYPEKGVEALLRSHIQFLPNVHFIFAGSKQHLMQEMFLSAKRPFYQSTQALSIGKIHQGEYYSFASAFFNAKKRQINEEIFSKIFEEFDGHTWYIQALLNRLFGYQGNPDMNSVNQAITEIISESTYAYEILLSSYPSNSIRLLKAIAKEKCVKEINASQFIAHYNLKAASSVNTALKKLIDKELVYKGQEGYIVYDRFMAIWLYRQSF